MTSIESARALYARTRKERFALGAFNVDNQETLIAVARAAATKKSPVLVEVSHGEVEMIGVKNLRAMVDHYMSTAAAVTAFRIFWRAAPPRWRTLRRN